MFACDFGVKVINSQVEQLRIYGLLNFDDGLGHSNMQSPLGFFKLRY